MNRRRFVKLAGAGLGAAALSVAPRSARATFGAFPAESEGWMLPPELQATNILEVFLYGGLSPWESLYLVEGHAMFEPSRSDARAFLADDCGLPVTELSIPYATDLLGAEVGIGPFAHALWGRPDVTDRMRVLVQQHDVDPLEAAIPLALTGKRVGNPTMAGLGAHVQRFFGDREPTRRSPFSYLLRPAASQESDAALDSALSTGMHPSTARPLRINVDGAERLGELLARPGAGTQRAEIDALLGVYLEQYERRTVWESQGPLRSARLAELGSAIASVSNADAVAEVIDPALLVPYDSVVCGQQATNVTGMSLRLAAHLLRHPTQPARYVGVVDSGLVVTPAGGYDAHYRSYYQAHNLHNLLIELLSVINLPGEADPTKLDLDDTLIILNTEFGRTGDRTRNHLPQAYTTAFIGGPVTAGISGAIGPDATATAPVVPSENRIAALLALGIYPFEPESFAVSDAIGAGNEAEGVELVTANVLGVTP